MWRFFFFAAHRSWSALFLIGMAAGLVVSLIVVGITVSRAEYSSQEEIIKLFIPSVQNKDIGKQYYILGWNDLGMHCYDQEYSTLSILPPYNTMWAQVIQRGDPPQIITSGVTVNYSFLNNTVSSTKTNFWEWADELFGLPAPLTPDIGLTGHGLTGAMDRESDHFVITGVPLTEFLDGETIRKPFQLAVLTAKLESSGQVIDVTTIVAPISSEIACDDCHGAPGEDFKLSILQSHDEENGTTLATSQPVLCASCHADPALGAPGQPGLPTFSAAMHGHHAEEAAVAPGDCYACHPGRTTRCLRDVMSTEHGLWCTDCHGSLADLGSESRTPWVDEPRCGDCHDPQYAENQGTLYRFSTGHGGLACESCHNSTHAILPSSQPNDNLQAIRVQGYAGTIQECTVCHLTTPSTGGPHR